LDSFKKHTMTDPVLIVSLARTPMGSFQGELSALTGPQLGSAAIAAALARAGLAPEQVDEVLMGCVLSAGLGQAPARQAALGAGLPLSAGATTISKVCGSGMRAVMFAHDMLIAGSAKVIVAGGMESMSNAPYLLAKARGGLRLGHGEIKDHLFMDGLEDAYARESTGTGSGAGRLMGTFAEECADQFGLSRETQDAYAVRSTQRAQAATKEGRFDWEITPVTVRSSKGETLVRHDEGPGKARLDKIPTLKPAFRKDGTVTAANSSSISDGAAAMVLMRASTHAALTELANFAKVSAGDTALKHHTTLATLVAHATHAQAPALFTTAPVGAIEAVLAKAGWSVGDVDLWEINEAFAVVTLAAIESLKLDVDRVNINGGACALGHPIGASGARIIATLIGALRSQGKRRGVAALCIGGGEATAVAIELL
jgi:acetyl-CoA C-acetyltransferase